MTTLEHNGQRENTPERGLINIKDLLKQLHLFLPAEGDSYFKEIETICTVGFGNGSMLDQLQTLRGKYQTELLRLQREARGEDDGYENDSVMIEENISQRGKIDTLERVIGWIDGMNDIFAK